MPEDFRDEWERHRADSTYAEWRKRQQAAYEMGPWVIKMPRPESMGFGAGGVITFLRWDMTKEAAIKDVQGIMPYYGGMPSDHPVSVEHAGRG